MNRIEDKNFFVVHGWMINQLHLKGTDLCVYAIIYGFTQDGEHWFDGSRQYLADFAGVSKTAIDGVLLRLSQKGLIEKQEVFRSRVKFCNYKAITNVSTTQDSWFPPPKKVGYPTQESCHHNIEIKKSDNIDSIKEDKSSFSPNDENTSDSENLTRKTTSKSSRQNKIFFDYETDAKIHGLTDELLAYWKEQCPAVDVDQEIKKAEVWLDSNRKNRKHDVKRFLANWLTRAQERARGYQNQNTTTNAIYNRNKGYGIYADGKHLTSDADEFGTADQV